MAGTLSPKAHNSAFRLNFYISLTSRPDPGPSESSSFRNIERIAASVGLAFPGFHYPAYQTRQGDQR